MKTFQVICEIRETMPVQESLDHIRRLNISNGFDILCHGVIKFFLLIEIITISIDKTLFDKSVQFMDFYNTAIIEIIAMGDGECECIEILFIENGKFGLEIQAVKAEYAMSA